VVAGDHENPVESERRAVARLAEELDVDHVARGDAVLLTATFDHCIHRKTLPESSKTRGRRKVPQVAPQVNESRPARAVFPGGRGGPTTRLGYPSCRRSSTVMAFRLAIILTALYLRLLGARRRVLADGPVSLVYYVMGPEDGEPWVMLHGLGSIAATWGPV